MPIQEDVPVMRFRRSLHWWLVCWRLQQEVAGSRLARTCAWKILAASFHCQLSDRKGYWVLSYLRNDEGDERRELVSVSCSEKQSCSGLVTHGWRQVEGAVAQAWWPQPEGWPRRVGELRANTLPADSQTLHFVSWLGGADSLRRAVEA